GESGHRRNGTSRGKEMLAKNSGSSARSAFNYWRNRQETSGGAGYCDCLMKHTVPVVTILIALSVISVVAADWPSLYGPRRNHTSDQKGLLRSWPQEGPKVLWT